METARSRSHEQAGVVRILGYSHGCHPDRGQHTLQHHSSHVLCQGVPRELKVRGCHKDIRGVVGEVGGYKSIDLGGVMRYMERRYFEAAQGIDRFYSSSIFRT
jgi:hypothetical protein